MSHTPGPWTVHHLYTTGEIYVEAHIAADEHKWAVAKVAPRTLGNVEANARLIAAAPDLLAACEAISEALVKGELIWKHKRQSDGDPYHPANVALCAAIAKARAEVQP